MNMWRRLEKIPPKSWIPERQRRACARWNERRLSLAAAQDFEKLAAAIRQARAQNPSMKIEVEADKLEQVRALVQIEGVDVILLDNMETAEMREAIALGRKHNVKFEASGGINLRTVRRIAATGVDYISVGALTHSPRAIDLSLELTHVGS